MNKIKRVSWFFRVLFQIIFVVWPLLLAIAWIKAPAMLFTTYIQMDFIPRGYPVLHDWDVTTKLLGFLVSMIPVSFGLYVLYSLIKLFRLYEQGEIFSFQTVRRMRNAAYGLLIGQLVNPFYDLLISLTLTWHNPPHQHLRYASITVDQTNIGILLTSLLIILISWIMMEGCKLREEQQLTI